MTKRVIVWDDGDGSTIEVYSDEPVIAVTASRDDLLQLAKLDEALRPGIYILMHKNKRYIGQASASIYSRLKEHNKNKDWWSEIAFISREDGRLDKSQLDFMENKLINDFKNAGFDTDNDTMGNKSHIESYQKGKALQILISGLTLLKDTAKVDVFKKATVRKNYSNNDEKVKNFSGGEPVESTSTGSYKIIDDAGNSVEGISRKQCFINYLKILCDNDKYFMLFEQNAKNTVTKGLFQLRRNISQDREHLYSLLKNDLFIYSTLSSGAFDSSLNKINEIIHINPTMTIVDSSTIIDTL